MRPFYSLEEFDAFVCELNAQGSEEERIPILSNCYLADPTLLDMPSDPFSDEYHQAVLNVHARISGRQVYDAQTMEHTPLDIEATIARAAAYQNGGKWLGDYLESYGHVIKCLEVKPGMRVIEYGCGDAEISLHLARLGCDVTVIDIEPNYIEVVKQKAARLKIPINAICGGFLSGNDLGRFDRAFFYQAFHHSLEHQRLVENLRGILKPGGFIVFGPEPVIDREGPWQHAVPYAWGPRLDGLSLRAMRTHGWMELGFQEPYFIALLERNGWTYEKFVSPTNGLVSSITAKRREESDRRPLPLASDNASGGDNASREADVRKPTFALIANRKKRRNMMKKAIAEFIGTFALVLVGCGAAVIGGMGSGATAVDLLGIAAAFGLALVAMAYGIGQVSGCHINPAVSFGVLISGRMTTPDFIAYVIAQVLGAIAGAATLYLILSGKASGWDGGLGQNGWGPGYLGEYGLTSAFVYEVAGTFLFLVCILGVTQRGAPVGLAGLAIGLALVAVHLVGINVTGTSVNPARSLGPALVGYGTNPGALSQVWLFIIAPLIGASIAGFLFRPGGVLAADDVIPERGEGASDVAPAASAPRKGR